MTTSRVPLSTGIALVSDAARALAPRARLRGPSMGPRTVLALEFVVQGLPAADFARLHTTAGLALEEGQRVGTACLGGPADVLRELVDAIAAERGPRRTEEDSEDALGILLSAHINAHRAAPPGRIMGVLNVTPDSFSDGGRFDSVGLAIAQGLKLISEGAEILDVGGESTRPGAARVSEREERERVVPVIAGLAEQTSCQISIDTTKAAVARDAIRAGATMVNDISAGRFDAELFDVVAEHGADIVLMHMQNSPRNMQEAPAYGDVVSEVTEHLRERAAAGMRAGISTSKMYVDPGIGFGKRLSDNLELIRSLPELRSLGLPIVLGVSRKSFLGALTGEEQPSTRLAETLSAVSIGSMLGVDIHRVHDAAPARAAVTVAEAIRTAPQEEQD